MVLPTRRRLFPGLCPGSRRGRYVAIGTIRRENDTLSQDKRARSQAWPWDSKRARVHAQVGVGAESRPSVRGQDLG